MSLVLNGREKMTKQYDYEKTNIMHMRKQRREADQRLCFR